MDNNIPKIKRRIFTVSETKNRTFLKETDKHAYTTARAANVKFVVIYLEIGSSESGLQGLTQPKTCESLRQKSESHTAF